MFRLVKWFIQSSQTCLLLALLVTAALVDISEGQRRGGRRGGRRRGRQEVEAGYAAPSDAGYSAPAEYGSGQAVYGDASDAVPTYAAGDDALAALAANIPGVPGEDYPIYAEVPESGFACDGQVDGGYYADPEAECQAFHICTADGAGGLAKYSFLCPNGTLFNQNYFICDWWFNFDCSTAEELYSLNDEIAAERDSGSGEASGSAPEGSYTAAPAEASGSEASGEIAEASGEAADDGSGSAPVYTPAGKRRRGKKSGGRRKGKRQGGRRRSGKQGLRRG